MWCDWIVECTFLNMLWNKVALVLDNIQCKALIWVTKIIVWQCSSVFYMHTEREREREGSSLSKTACIKQDTFSQILHVYILNNSPHVTYTYTTCMCTHCYSKLHLPNWSNVYSSVRLIMTLLLSCDHSGESKFINLHQSSSICTGSSRSRHLFTPRLWEVVRGEGERQCKC